MTWADWEQIKADVAERQPGHMQLNQLAASGGGEKDLVVRDDKLGQLGNMAYELRERLSKDSDHARPSTFEAATGLFNDGLDMGAALTELHDSWNSQARTLVDACGHISNHLDFTRSLHRKDEDKIATSIRASRISDYISN
ncbi:hypothetical protein [Streptomyces sp. NPDC051214]|uniref:hypothetical protein n=1 Tax=Streptomyces sp. NPDC051214 TaxID=3155282 RepID=UPI00342BD2E1